MADPFLVMGVTPESDDDSVRRRYLELVRQFPPEKHPERFAAIRAAYEEVKDAGSRLRYRLFEAGQQETVQALIEEIACQTSRQRLSLETLLAPHRRG